MNKIPTRQQLRHITLQSQGLLHPAPFGKGKQAVVNAVEQLGYLQIDTLSIVERAHHHTLWARIADYNTDYLDDLVKERKLFEYWFHAASYLPMKDYRYALPRMQNIKKSERYYYQVDAKIMQLVIDTIRAEGAKKARDFETESKKAGTWWNWKPTKLALEKLFMQGDLMISQRSGMQKTYDLTERVLPQNINTTEPTPIEYAQYWVETYLRAYGFSTLKQITHLKTESVFKKNVNEVLQSMLHSRAIQKINIAGMPPVFIQSHLVDTLYKTPLSNIQILSPFDNAIIHRDRIKHLFDFDFRLECYLPKEKRQYGYFCLPILLADTFIGRVDCKAHRSEKKLEIIHLHIETQNLNTESWLMPFAESISRFATFNNCQSITLSKVTPSKLTDALTQAIAALPQKTQ